MAQLPRCRLAAVVIVLCPSDTESVRSRMGSNMKTGTNPLLLGAALLALAACAPQSGEQKQAQANPPAPAPAAGEPVKSIAPDLPAGTYTLDKSHTSLLFRINHLGFSMYTARFKRFDAELQF